jgi:hypothetical protein
MRRTPVFCIALLFYCAQRPALMAQTPDPRVDKLAPDKLALDKLVEKLVMDTQELKRTVADQDKRIAELEKTVRMLQSAAAPPPPAPIPAPAPPWKTPTSWNLIKAGMSEAQVVEILGPPTGVQSVEDSRTLFYQPDSHSTSTLNGSVTLKDDRVTMSSPPAF